MREILFKKKEPVAEFTLDLFLTDLFIYDTKVLNKDLLPVVFDEKIDERLTLWGRERAILLNKNLTDEEIMDFYDCIYRFTLGRMDPYLIPKAVLEYMKSEKDDYSISPVKEEKICFVFTDNRFPVLYFLKPDI